VLDKVGRLVFVGTDITVGANIAPIDCSHIKIQKCFTQLMHQ
jgi:hypothetical protein